MADYKKSSVHCHSTMCDGKNTLQEMASAACAQGLTTLGFTGHSYTQRDREYCMSPSRTAQYKATIAKLKTEYKGKVDILCGIEPDEDSALSIPLKEPRDDLCHNPYASSGDLHPNSTILSGKTSEKTLLQYASVYAPAHKNRIRNGNGNEIPQYRQAVYRATNRQ